MLYAESCVNSCDGNIDHERNLDLSLFCVSTSMSMIMKAVVVQLALMLCCALIVSAWWMMGRALERPGLDRLVNW